MTVTTITSRMNEKYLRNKSKHEIISLMLLFWNGSQLQETEAKLSEAVALIQHISDLYYRDGQGIWYPVDAAAPIRFAGLLNEADAFLAAFLNSETGEKG